MGLPRLSLKRQVELVPSVLAGLESNLSLLQRLLALVKSSKTNIRLRERAALAAGSLCLGDGKFPHRRNLLESFNELHFSIGEALVFCSLTRSTQPSVKQAACLWLLAVVKQCISQSQVIRLCPLFQSFIKEMELPI